MKWPEKIAALILIVIFCWWAWGRFWVSDEWRIQRQIAAMEQALEDNQLRSLSERIARDYSDEHGLDRSSLLAALRLFRGQQESLLIHISDLTITVQRGTDTAQATLVSKALTKPRGGGQRSLEAQRLLLHFRKEERVWRLTRAESPQLKFD